ASRVRPSRCGGSRRPPPPRPPPRSLPRSPPASRPPAHARPPDQPLHSMLLRLPVLAFVLLAACGDTEPLQSPVAPSAEADEEDPAASGDGIVGMWELVAQEGYPVDLPEGVEQRLTFYADGRMTLATQADG